jgi:hypothetical protein
MRKFVLRSPRLASILATAAVVLAASGGWAVGATTGSSIHACASKMTGALRLARRCGRKERPVVWNVQGPPGLIGNTGPQGPGATALHYRVAVTAPGPPTQLATSGPFTFTEQCQPGTGTVEAILNVTASDPWHGYGTDIVKDFNAGPSAATYELGPTFAAGTTYALADVTTPNSDDVVQAVNFQLVDDSTGQVYVINATIEAGGFHGICDGVGAVIPAS